MINSISKELNAIQIPYYKGELSMLPFNLNDLSTIPIELKETVEQMVKNLPNKVGTAFLTGQGKLVKKAKRSRYFDWSRR